MRVDHFDPHAVLVSDGGVLLGFGREGPGDGSVTVVGVSTMRAGGGDTLARRTGLGSARVPIATGDCVDGGARTCYSNHPVGQPPKASDT
jgi:hypothetical protein